MNRTIKGLTALSVAACCLLPQTATARPRRNPYLTPPPQTEQRTWRDVYRHQYGWHSVDQGRAVTGFRQGKRATIITVEYNRDGSVKRSQRITTD